MPELEDEVDMKAYDLAQRLTALFKKPWLPHEGELLTSFERRGNGPESTSGLGILHCGECGEAFKDHPIGVFCYVSRLEGKEVDAGGPRRDKRRTPLPIQSEQELRIALQKPEVFFL